MKRIIIAVVALFACAALSAQNRGDKYIAASVSASFGTQNTESYDGLNTTTQQTPLTTSLGGQVEFGYFVAKNFRLALCLGVPFNSTPVSQSGTTWLKSNTLGFQINPNIAYYVRLADRLYYTPEIGFNYEFGSYKEDMTASFTYNAYYSGWNVYANLLAFEFQVNSKIALGVGLGSISYSTTKISDKSSHVYVGSSQFLFNLNSTSLHVRFYL